MQVTYSRQTGSHSVILINHQRWILAILLAMACNFHALASFSEPPQKEQFSNETVFIYYFYFVPRCDECIILDNALKKLLDQHYKGETAAGKLVYRQISLNEPDDDEVELIKELRVRRQLLLLVAGKEIINLTRDAFRYVERDPGRFSLQIRNSINTLLEKGPAGSDG